MLDVNTAFERITGYRHDEVVGRRAGEQTRSSQHSPAFYRELWHALATSGLGRGEIVNRRRNGELLVEMLTISAVRNSSSGVSHYVGVFIDITEPRKNQQRLAFRNHHDPLTRLPNRTLLADRMLTAIGRAQSSGLFPRHCGVSRRYILQRNDQWRFAVGSPMLQTGVRKNR